MGSGALRSARPTSATSKSGGNASLKPEIGDTRTIGVVFTPTFLDGFTATVDYFNIDVSNAISSISPTVTLAECYGSSATRVPKLTSARWCIVIALGQLYGSGFVTATNQNTGFEHTKGWDFEANYNLSLDACSFTVGMACTPVRPRGYLSAVARSRTRRRAGSL